MSVRWIGKGGAHSSNVELILKHRQECSILCGNHGCNLSTMALDNDSLVAVGNAVHDLREPISGGAYAHLVAHSVLTRTTHTLCTKQCAGSSRLSSSDWSVRATSTPCSSAHLRDLHADNRVVDEVDDTLDPLGMMLTRTSRRVPAKVLPGLIEQKMRVDEDLPAGCDLHALFDQHIDEIGPVWGTRGGLTLMRETPSWDEVLPRIRRLKRHVPRHKP
jgi:hypothetical protein